MSDNDHGFDATKIFYALFILTAVEVAWGYMIPYHIKWALWGGLLIMAFMKGFLIFMYFMHMKFEGWIVKCLIAPTIPLMLVVFFSLVPDIASNDRMNHDIADQLDPVNGEIAEIGTGSRNKAHAPAGDGGH
ncbi:MAG: cytochrome C oxidase subunit IV family protein [bacterium]|nr:cytochrome C oxidase subunit IV family protein [bacterium]